MLAGASVTLSAARGPKAGLTRESVAEATVAPADAGAQRTALDVLDSGMRRNDDPGCPAQDDR